jgi:NAD(P)-dependent dehydrogenase (short-subunit alcohol dehydrogenase family)
MLLHLLSTLIASSRAFRDAPLPLIHGMRCAFSQAGLSSMALGLWYELRPRGVDVVRAHVGPTDTPATRAMFTDKGLKSVPIQPVFEVSMDYALP